MIADESTQDEIDFSEVRKKPFLNQVPTAMVVSIDPRQSQIQFARAIGSNFSIVSDKGSN